MSDDNRRLTIVHTDFHRGWGGQINQVMTSCIGLQQRGHRVLLAVPEGGTPAERARAAGITVFGDVRFRGAGKVISLLHDAWALRRLIRTEKPDVIHSHGSQDTWAVALANKILPGGQRIPHLLTRHNTKRVRDHLFNRWLLGRLVDRLIVVAPEVLDRYRCFIERGLIDPERVPVLPSPLRPDLLTAPPDRGKLRRELQLEDNTLLIGTVARLVPDKGQRFLLTAAERLLVRGIDLHVVLAGDGSDTAALQAQAAASPTLSNRVHFLGYRSDVADITAALDLAVLPSIDCDASSGVVKEALALGVPVVATDIGAARAMLGDGAFGIVVPPADSEALADAIQAVAAQRDEARQRAVAGGIRIRQEYTVERLVLGLEAVYREHAHP
ncbi:MAG: glycosyltransferase family 4 protein [Acidobacteriota bacterium]